MKTVCDKFGALLILDEVDRLLSFSLELITDGIYLSGYEWHGSCASISTTFLVIFKRW